MVSVRSPGNAVHATSYDAFGRVLTQTDAAAAVTSYTYDKAARSMTVTTPEGVRTTTTYSRHGQVQTITDGREFVTSHSYDRNGNLLATSSPLTTTSSRYDATGQLLETTDAAGTKVAYSYDAAGRVLTRRVDPTGLNLTTSYQYDGKGQAVAVTDANGVLTTTTYDRGGNRLRQVVDPAGLNLQTVYTYDAGARVLSVTLPGGTLTQYAYDALGRRVQERQDPNGLNLTRTWAYDNNSNVAAVTDAGGHVTRYGYDGADRLAITVTADGSVRQHQYDAEGRVVQTTSRATPVGAGALAALPPVATLATLQSLVVPQATQDVVEHRVYDKDGRVAATLDGNGAVVRYDYDANGNVLTRTAYATRVDMATWTAGTVPVVAADAARDERVSHVYDAQNRAIFTVTAVRAVVAQLYDGNGNVLRRTGYATAIAEGTALTENALTAACAAVANTARDALVRNTYDAAGRLTWSADGAGAVTQRLYDANGNLVCHVEYASTINIGSAPASVPPSAADRVHSRAYDAANRLVIEVDAVKAVTEHEYAGTNVVRRVSYATPIGSVPALGTLNSAKAIRDAVTPNASDRVVRFGYDAVGRIAFTIDASGAASETRYDGNGNVVASIRYANLANAALLPPIATLDVMRGAVAAAPAADRIHYNAYDAAGRRVYEVAPTLAVTATQYDGAGRVIRTVRYANLLTVMPANTAPGIASAVVADAADQADVFGYNAAGLLVSAQDALGQVESFSYDALGRKTGHVDKAGSAWTYDYDAAGRLVQETSPQVALTNTAKNAAGVAEGAVQMAAVVTHMGYDALGNLTQRTEAAGRQEQRTTRYEYDQVGRQVHVVFEPVEVDNQAGTTIESFTWYDALGNAVANRDVGGGTSQKAYDQAGRLAFDVDALGYVTRYTRNAFGEVADLVRYGTETALASGLLTQAYQAVTKAQMEAVVAGFAPGNARQLSTSYDRAGRVVQVVEPEAYISELDAAGNRIAGIRGKTTARSYDAFGHVVQEKVLRNAADSWSVTTRYYDKAGREYVTVDALGYVTRRGFDAMGNVTSEIEFATAMAPGTWSAATYAEPGRVVDDRIVLYAYDRLNRRTSEIRVDVEHSTAPNAVAARGNLVTLYGHDALGNQTSVTDAEGRTTFHYFDRLGRLQATASPARNSTVGDSWVTPLTTYRRDAHGNVLAKVEYLRGLGGQDAAGLAVGIGGAEDRITRTAYDKLGRMVQATDANGNSEFFSYDAAGRVARKWQAVTSYDGVTQTLFQVNTYDKLGQLTGTRTPKTTAIYNGVDIVDTTQAAAGEAVESLVYNGFGELTRKTSADGRQEFFDYDQAGRLWRSNAGTAGERIQLFDAQGNVTAELRSAGGGANVNVTNLTSAQAADASPGLRRTETRYDAMGRVVAQLQPEREEQSQGAVVVRRQFTTFTIDRSTPNVNQVKLTWNSLAELGSGEVKVTVEYRTPPVPQAGSGWGEPVSTPGKVLWAPASVFAAESAANGVTLAWAATADHIGVEAVTRIQVWKRDVSGGWAAVIDQFPGHGGNEIAIALPSSLTSAAQLQLRVSGSGAAWGDVPFTHFGDQGRFDARGLSPANYDYRVLVSPIGDGTRTVSTGTLAVTQPPLNIIPATPSFTVAGTGVLGWTAPASSVGQVLRHRPQGGSGEWTGLPIVPRNNGTHSGVDTSALVPGTYDFELLWYEGGSGAPTSHAVGFFTVVAAQPSVWIAPVNLPNITGVVMTTTSVYPDITIPALTWNHGGVTSASLRYTDGNWYEFPIVFEGGVQKMPVWWWPPGLYEFRLHVGSPPTAHATGLVQIYATTPGYHTTVWEQVAKYKPYVQYYEPIYETRYEWRYAPQLVRVNDPPYIYGYDENNNALWAYPYHEEWQYTWQYVAYQVQIGSTPVYLYDYMGNIVYTTEWVWESRQVWVPPATPAPTYLVSTPPHTPAYWTQPLPQDYHVSMTTAGGTKAVSTSDGATIAQSAVANGDQRLLRPVVQQKTDRWGNVIEITDPRTIYWKTTYRYNAWNQVVTQTQPIDSGLVDSTNPVTRIFYDKLGRQIATQDANGNVNGYILDQGGNVHQERHADGGTVTHRYNAFGEKVQTIDAMSLGFGFTYDKMGHLLSTQRGSARVYAVGADGLKAFVREGELVDSWTYDQLGRKTTQTNGNGQIIRYRYDLRGNLLGTVQPLGQTLRAAYDQDGHKVAELDANGRAMTWTYDVAGLLVAHTDLHGAGYHYTYDNARQLIAQISGHGQSLAYSYDAAGQLRKIIDAANPMDATDTKTTTYEYDRAGRRIRERVVQHGATYQDNHLAYDARGNLRMVVDARVHMAMEYDKAGNRTRVYTRVGYQGVGGEQSSATDRYFKYDAMNRQVVVDAVNANHDIERQGHLITYDLNGNRSSDTSWSTRKVSITSGSDAIGYDGENVMVWGTTPPTYAAAEGLSTESYKYDRQNRLYSVDRDGTQIDRRFYDAADRVVQSGPDNGLPTAYANIINAGLAPGQMNGNELRSYIYDANGRLLHQHVRNSNLERKADISFHNGWKLTTGSVTYDPAGYDAAGNSQGYVVQDHASASITQFSTSFRHFDGYQAGETTGEGNKQSRGTSTQDYDTNGFLVGMRDSALPANNRVFVNDVAGRALFVKQGDNVQRQLIANGEVLGIYGAAVNQKVGGSNPAFENLVDFDFGYAPITASYPSASPGVYTARSGDTLQSIAQSAYGDSSLWYRIAEANGLRGNGDLKVGQTLNIPNRVGTVSNNNSTFKPYDPSRIEGDKTPHLPMAKGDTGCGGAGQLLMVIVAVVVTILTAGAAAAGLGAVGTSGAGALAGVAASTTATGFVGTMTAGMAALGGSYGAGIALAAGAMAGALGSVASQGVGLAIGAQDRFNWKSVALSAVGSGAGAGLGASGISGTVARLTESTALGAVAQAAVGSVISQGIGVATGVQRRFDWRGVAASAVGAGVGAAVGEGFGLNSEAFSGLSLAEQFGRRFVTGLIAGSPSAVIRGGREGIQHVAVDAFGNALGWSLAASSGQGSGSSEQHRDPLGDFINENMPAWEQRHATYDAIVGAFANPPAVDRSNDVLTADRLTLSNTRSDAAAENNVFSTIQARQVGKAQANIDALNALGAELAQERALRNIGDLADAYRASGMTGATGDPLDLMAPSPMSSSGGAPAAGNGDRWYPHDGGGTVIGAPLTPADEAELDAQGFGGINDQKVAAGTYDRLKEMGGAWSAGRYGDFLRHFAYDASDSAKQALAQRNVPAPLNPNAVRINNMLASPIGAAASVIGRGFGASQHTQDALLATFGWGEQVAGAVTGIYKQTLTAHAPIPGVNASKSRGGPLGPYPIADASNYAALFRKARPDLPRDWQVHHSIPQRYDELMGTAGINIHETQFLRGVPQPIHSKVTTEWERFHRGAGGDPTAAQVADFAKVVDKRYGGYFLWPGF